MLICLKLAFFLNIKRTENTHEYVTRCNGMSINPEEIAKVLPADRFLLCLDQLINDYYLLQIFDGQLVEFNSNAIIEHIIYCDGKAARQINITGQQQKELDEETMIYIQKCQLMKYLKQRKYEKVFVIKSKFKEQTINELLNQDEIEIDDNENFVFVE